MINIMKHTHAFITALLLLPLAAQAAELKLAALFSDHMVLQCDKPVPIWGWAPAGEKITVEFAGQTQKTTADANGKWTVKLDALKASAEPRELKVGGIIIRDVLVGEVWLGSGQSNMAMGVSRARDYNAEQVAANLPLIRMFKENSAAANLPQSDASGQWVICSSETVGTFSATLYFFGRELYRELKVPMGLINSSVGGTPIESWVAEEAQKQLPKAKATGQKVPRKPTDPLDMAKRKGSVGGLFNGKIAPLIPYAMRGAMWYQGEANSHPGKGLLYQYQLPLLVNDWRMRWGEEFPFAWVQLPNFTREGDGWPLVREGMLKTLKLLRTGMAITIDIGDPQNIHPQNKQDVGKRLALWALGDVYGRKVVSTSGPLPAGHEVRGSEIVLSFKHADAGLKAKEGALKGFVIAGEDKKWMPAQAVIEGDKIIVSSGDVKKPLAVRYAWSGNPDCNLYNGAVLPASPFRTDDWN
jgi:sialate O-acetylesterase